MGVVKKCFAKQPKINYEKTTKGTRVYWRPTAPYVKETIPNGTPSDMSQKLPSRTPYEAGAMVVMLKLEHQQQALCRLPGMVRAAGEVQTRQQFAACNSQLLHDTGSDFLTILASQEVATEEEVIEAVKYCKQHHIYGTEFDGDLDVCFRGGSERMLVKCQNVNDQWKTVTIKVDPVAAKARRAFYVVITLYYHTFTEAGDPGWDYAGHCIVPIWEIIEKGYHEKHPIRDLSLPIDNNSIPPILMPEGTGPIKAVLELKTIESNLRPIDVLQEKDALDTEPVPKNMVRCYNMMVNAITRGLEPYYDEDRDIIPLASNNIPIHCPAMATYVFPVPGCMYALLRPDAQSPVELWHDLLMGALSDFRYLPLASGTPFTLDDPDARLAHFLETVDKQFTVWGPEEGRVHPDFYQAVQVVAMVCILFCVSLFYESDFVNLNTLAKAYKQELLKITDKFTDMRTTFAGDCDTGAGAAMRFVAELMDVGNMHANASTPLWLTSMRDVLRLFVPLQVHPRVASASLDAQTALARQNGSENMDCGEPMNHMHMMLVPRNIFYQSVEESMQNPVVRKYVRMPEGKRLKDCMWPWSNRPAYIDADWMLQLKPLILELTGRSEVYNFPLHWLVSKEMGITEQEKREFDTRNKLVQRNAIAQVELTRDLARKGVDVSALGTFYMGCDFPTDTPAQYLARKTLASTFYKVMVGAFTDDLVRSGVNIAGFYFAQQIEHGRLGPKLVWGVPFSDIAMMDWGWNPKAARQLDTVNKVLICPETMFTEEEMSIAFSAMNVDATIPRLVSTSFTPDEMRNIQRAQNAIETVSGNPIPYDKYVTPNISSDTVMVAYYSSMREWEERHNNIIKAASMEGYYARLEYYPVAQHPYDSERCARNVRVVICKTDDPYWT